MKLKRRKVLVLVFLCLLVKLFYVVVDVRLCKPGLASPSPVERQVRSGHEESSGGGGGGGGGGGQPSTVGCQFPMLKARRVSGPTRRLACNQRADVVELFNGVVTVRVPPGAFCAGWRIERRGDFAVDIDPTGFYLIDGMDAPVDLFYAKCVDSNRSTIYINIHATVARNDSLHARRPAATGRKGLGLNVIMLGLDSASRVQWPQLLPLWSDFFVHTLRGVVFEGYSVVGDGTTPALLSLLAGRFETELHEARRGVAGATEVDDFPWIWREYKEAGYVTLYSEDRQRVGAFQHRLMGFRDPPVDHYLRPFYLADEYWFRRSPGCHDNLTQHQQALNVVRDAALMYHDKLLLSLTFMHSTASDDLQHADADLLAFTADLHARGYLDRSVLVAFGDHGQRVRASGVDAERKHEERLPFLGIRVPAEFAKEYPDLAKNLRDNAHRLTTPFDLHETLRHVIDVDHTSSDSARGISLLRPIPAERSCEDAEIPPHWCACLTWETLQVGDDDATAAANAAVALMNKMIETVHAPCEVLSVRKVHSARRLFPNQFVQAFNGSSDPDGRVASFHKAVATPPPVHVQLVLETAPNGAMFEATVAKGISDHRFTADDTTLRRLNRYDKQATCIDTTFPHLAKFCLCK